MKKIGNSILLLASLITLPGCQRLFNWGKRTLYQGVTVSECLTKQSEKYIRSIWVYEQFATQAHFIALWLTPTVQKAAIDLYTMRNGCSKNSNYVYRPQIINEFGAGVFFYVMSLHSVQLGNDWTVRLVVDNVSYCARSMKKVELDFEYKEILKKDISPFMEVYALVFPNLDIHEKPIINQNTSNVSLEFYNANKKVSLSWHVQGDSCLADVSYLDPQKPYPSESVMKHWGDSVYEDSDRRGSSRVCL